MPGKQLAIDLGTANVLVYVKGRGIVDREPSVVAVSSRHNRIEAVGEEARDMLGRTPGTISVIRPMRDGVIADYLVTEAMLRYFINRVCGTFRLFKPQVLICVPAGGTSVEHRAVRDAAEHAGARRPAGLLPEPLAAALGARLPVGSPRGNMVVDIGGGRTEAAVISMYGIVEFESVRVAGDQMDLAIVNYIKRRHNLIIGERSAEDLKVSIGSALPLEEELTAEVRGRDQVTGMPKTIETTSTEISLALAEPLSAIVAAARAVLERTPAELASDVIDQGIVLTGGGALLRNLDRMLTQEIGLPCQVAEDSMDAVALGAGIALENLEVIRRSLPDMEDVLARGFLG